MKIYSDLHSFKKIKNPIVTTGTFDGVHLGHQKIINRVKEIAKNENGESVLLTFFPHPRMVLFPDDNDLKLICSQEEKIELLEKTGAEHLIIYPFTKEFSRMTAVQYVRNILVNKIGLKKIVVGYNHYFGRNREGSFKDLIQFGHSYNFEVEEIPAIDIEKKDVSSTKIRNAILGGDVKTANLLLGHPYSLRGEVVEGNKNGGKIGFPTANILVKEKYKLIPADGVYAVDVAFNNNSYKGMMNIGVRPTFENSEHTIEVHIFDFEEPIYYQILTIYFKDKIRDEKKFNSAEELKNQLIQDKLIAEKS